MSRFKCLQTLKAYRLYNERTWKWCHPLEILGNCRVQESCWCAAALASLTHGHAVGGIIHYMEKTIGFHVTRNGTLTMCAISWQASPVLLIALTSAPREMHGLGYTGGKCDMIKMTQWASVTQSSCRVQRHSVTCSRSEGRMLASTEGLNLDLCGWLVVSTPLVLWPSWHFSLDLEKNRFAGGKMSWKAQEKKRGPQEPCHCSPVTSGPVFTPSF